MSKLDRGADMIVNKARLFPLSIFTYLKQQDVPVWLASNFIPSPSFLEQTSKFQVKILRCVVQFIPCFPLNNFESRDSRNYENMQTSIIFNERGY